MAQNGPTLVPEESFAEFETTELSAIPADTGRWTRTHPVAIHKAIEAHLAVSDDGTGVHISARERSAHAGATWIRRSSWWLQVHAPLGTPGVIDTGVDDIGQPWAVLERPAGRSFRSWRDEVGPLPFVEVARAVTGAAALLEPIHAAGWAHRDLRLDTLYRTPSGMVHLFGWGEVGSAPGTDATPSGVHIDIAGLGAVAVELLAPDAGALIRAGRIRNGVGMALPDKTLPMRVLRHVLSRAMHPDPLQRWPDVGSFRQELRSWTDRFGRGRWG